MGPLFEYLGSFWSVLGPGHSKIMFLSPLVPALGGFWKDFGAVWEPFGRPKVRKSGPKSIPKLRRNVGLFFL